MQVFLLDAIVNIGNGGRPLANRKTSDKWTPRVKCAILPGSPSGSLSCRRRWPGRGQLHGEKGDCNNDFLSKLCSSLFCQKMQYRKHCNNSRNPIRLLPQIFVSKNKYYCSQPYSLLLHRKKCRIRTRYSHLLQRQSFVLHLLLH